ncbi:MAG TPA: SIS domain-containing protein [Devosiaceae bacterium]|nr:SIS domain-containing protein [Devosiaceae bacterium]
MSNTSAGSSYLRDILSQPEYLRGLRSDDIVEAAAPVWRRVGDYSRIILTGMGASHAALRPLWLSLVAQGRPAWLLDASELLASCLPLVDASTLVVAASQSGRSAELVALAEAVAERGGKLLAITNDAESPLARRSAATVDIRAGTESTVSTKTYVNTLAVGLILGRPASGPAPDQVLRQAADGIEAYLQDWQRHVTELHDAVGLPERLYFLARGTSLAAAECGALITKEAAKWPVEALSAAQFRHGPLELADPRLSVIILGGEDAAARDLNRRLYRDLAGYGARTHWLDSGGDGGALSLPAMPTGTRPLAEIVPLQLLTVAIAENAGLEPGVFRHLTKVTTVL